MLWKHHAENQRAVRLNNWDGSFGHWARRLLNTGCEDADGNRLYGGERVLWEHHAENQSAEETQRSGQFF